MSKVNRYLMYASGANDLYEVINFDRSMGKVLTNSELFSKLQISEETLEQELIELSGFDSVAWDTLL